MHQRCYDIDRRTYEFAIFHACTILWRCLDRWPDARHVHRLDQDTSGLVVMALTIEAAREMCRQFRERGEGGCSPITAGLVAGPAL